MENPEEDQLNSLMKFLRNEVDSEISLKLARSSFSESAENFTESNTAMFSSNRNFTSEQTKICYFCGKPGHIKPYCKQFKTFMEEQGCGEYKRASVQSGQGNHGRKENSVHGSRGNYGRKENEAAAANTAWQNDGAQRDSDEGKCILSIGNLRKDKWILDSAATRNACNNKNFFKNLDLSYRGRVKLADGGFMSVLGIGSVKLKVKNEIGGIQMMTANNVLYIPSLIGNVLSVDKFEL